ncbi:MAG TPA: zf-HC2 domain-containing protein [Planctomycetota bacterium]|nr:zf-HC2 domain-containing protein [Planctomycetota bacterium]
MNCDDFRKKLHAYYTDTLAAAQRAELEAHAASGCGPCGQLWALARELSCRELVEFLDDYVEARLPAERLAVFERHIAVCGDCRDYIAGYRRVQHVAHVVLCAEIEGPLPEELLRAILAARRA